MIEIDQLYLLPAKIIEVFLYIIVLFSLNKKYKGIPLMKRPSLHIYFLMGIAGWILYMVLDTIIFAIAPLSLEGPLTLGDPIKGYTSEYPSLFFANILRDIGIIGAILTAWFYCMAAVRINTGISLNRKIFGSKKKILPIKGFKITWGHFSLLLAISLLIVFIILDQIKIEILDSTTVHVSSDWGIAMILIIILYGFSTILMVKQLFELRKTQMEIEFKRRAKFLGWSIIIFTSGIYYWALLGYLVGAFPSLKEFSLEFLYLGHILWMTSAIFVYSAFKQRKSDSIVVEQN
ncbi:hypothetical protein DSAG12_02862 [Promethearchaeum syntrophicum]|uniref:Uncharacterized protein n=1 Tax=Promethearchaeum syntrophicum TaxID=2594042 RepID=A0A5B9DE12_9ARCH|nr:hypothetical protein [Candidatus Prometheoarchaeum syntrophicum]QEE17030.1 hypothetical protein DSAG12_02862 [Candidatus Prometheoarchaeum syntrophicum]